MSSKDEWLNSYTRITTENYELFVRRLAEYNVGDYARNHFSPADVAYIRCAFKDYIIDYFLPLVEYLIKKDLVKKDLTKKGKK